MPALALRLSIGFLALAAIHNGSFFHRRFTPLDAGVCLFLLYALVSSAWAAYPWAAYQFGTNVLAVTLLYFLLRSRSTGGGVPAAILGAAVVLAVVALWQGLVLHAARPAATYVNPNYLADALFFGLIVVLDRIFSENAATSVPRTIGLLAVALLLGAAIWLTRSRAAAAMAVGTGLMLLFASNGPKVKRVIGASALAFLALLLAWSRRSFSEDPFAFSRLLMWKAAWKTALAHPFGVGMGGYRFFWLTFRDPLPGVPFHYGKTAATAHSQFFGLLADLGFPGAFLGLIIAIAVLVLAIREIRRKDRRLSFALIPVAAAIHGLFDVSLDLPGIALPVAACAAILANRHEHRQEGEREVPSSLIRWALAIPIVAAIGYSIPSAAAFVSYDQGMALLKDGDTDHAALRFAIARRLDPLKSDYPDALASVNYRLFVKTGQERYIGEAINFEQEAVENAPASAFYLAQTGFLLGEYAGKTVDPAIRQRLRGFALRALERSLLLDPHSALTWQRMARLRVAGGDEEIARKLLEEAVRFEPNFVPAWLDRARLMERINPAGAAALYGKVLMIGNELADKPLDPSEREIVRFDEQAVRKRIRELKR